MDDCKQLIYPLGIQTFSDIREGGYVYVDKTAYIYNMLKHGKYYFLSRPRRFGKSLLLSTIETYFSGRRDLFKGLALDSLTENWEEHPVLHLDLNSEVYDCAESLESHLANNIKEWEQTYGVSGNDENSVSYRFSQVIKQAYLKTGKQVVVLVDEYDKPMLNAIDNDNLADKFRALLKAFYGNLKSMDRYIKFAFLTGVGRFSKVSIFSDLNNLRDISFEPAFSAICGITDEEIDTYFRDGVQCLANSEGTDYDTTRQELRRRYDGYHFAKDLKDVYNPFSLVSVFAANMYDEYWFETGTPTYIVKLIKSRNLLLRDFDGYMIDASRLKQVSILAKDPATTLFQSGYLTIKEHNALFGRFTLGYPNMEVEQGFFKFLMPLYLPTEGMSSEFNVWNFVDDVLAGRVYDFMTRLSSLIAGVPHYGPKDPHENHFQNAIYILFKLMGFYTSMEDHTSDGRIDLSVETPRYVYVFEFKINASASEAMDQIREKEYWRKFEASGKKIFLIGANFDSATHRLDDYTIVSDQ